MQCNTETFDTGSFYDNATNYRFQPTIAGYYTIIGSVQQVTSDANTYLLAELQKSGTAIARNTVVTIKDTATTLTAEVSAVVKLNGSTDHVELYANCSAASPSAAATFTFLSGYLVEAS